MRDSDGINRRDLIVKTAGAASATSALASMTPAMAQKSQPLPPGFDTQAQPLVDNWRNHLSEVVKINFDKDAPELAQDAVKERHRIYCYLLMKLIHRFWNGNKHGPLGYYPQRAKQIEFIQQSPKTQRYHGDRIANPEGTRINWDRTSDIISRASPSMATVRSLTLISIITTFLEAPPSTPSRA
jgi:hypothetical protein